MTRKQRGRVAGTYVAPHAGVGERPRCTRCDSIRETLEERPWEIDIAKLGELRAAIEKASPPYGEMVRADADGVVVWACPRHNSLVRIIGGTIHGGQRVDWRITARGES